MTNEEKCDIISSASQALSAEPNKKEELMSAQQKIAILYCRLSDEDELEGVLASLSVDVKKLLMQTAAGALFSVHNKHIIHSDLKLKNVLLVRNKTGNYVAKLIDFDSSYFIDKKPEEIIGTIDYYSPEKRCGRNIR